MPGLNYRRYYGILSGGVAIAIIMITALTVTVSAQQAGSILDQLPVQERVALREGRVIISGNNGQFIGRVLVGASADTAWQVLTDYDNFERFLPNVESSRLLEAQGNRHVFEQINRVQIFPINKRIRFAIAATESRPHQIRFTLVSGDVDSLDGVWRLDPIPGTSRQVLITHQVSINPDGGGITRNVFFNTYRNILEDTLAAVKQETEQRARQ